MNITLIRHPFDINTRLADIPPLWLKLIESRLERIGGHWLWTGGVAAPRNYPVMNVPGHGHAPVKRFVAHLFWDFEDRGSYVVNGPKHICNEMLCVHPKHLVITTRHPRAKDFDETLRPMA